MPKKYPPFVRFVFFLLLLLPFAAPADDIRIGLLAWQGEEEAESQWRPLLEALQDALPGHRLQPSYFDLPGMARAVEQRQLDFVVTNPGHYVALESLLGVTRIATQQIDPSQDSAHTVGSAVVVRADRSDLRRLEDLKGRRLAAVFPEAFGGYQVVWAELKRRGIDPEDGDVATQFTGFPQTRVLAAVESGEVDAGALRSCLLERLIREGRVPAGRYRVLSPQGAPGPCQSSSPEYPGWAFAAASQTSPDLAREVLIALLSLPSARTGQTWGVPADYYPVHEMLRELQVTPYDFLREHRLETQVRRYWPAAALLVVVLLAWLAYTLRVEVLVQRRTRELSAALAARDRLAESNQAHRLQMEHLSRLSVLGELSGTLAHELNHPLAAIGNYARSLTLRLARGKLSPDATAQAAAEIASEADRAAGILAGIRDFARKRARVRERCQLEELVQGALRLFHGMVAQTPKVEVIDRLPPEARTLLADPLQIQEVLLNLLKNALDAQRTAGRNDAPIEITLAPEAGTHVAISVRDRGTGLTPEEQARLFEPFFTTKADGMGLGLSICKTIVETHGGTLQSLNPAEGPGLILQFTLPVDQPPGPKNEPD